MADRLLMITWRDAARGTEARALEVFNEAIAILGRKQQEGRIESFDVALLEPNASLGGYMSIRGTREQISALRADDDFRRNTVDAALRRRDLPHRGVLQRGHRQRDGVVPARTRGIAPAGLDDSGPPAPARLQEAGRDVDGHRGY